MFIIQRKAVLKLFGFKWNINVMHVIYDVVCTWT